ncbi:hypothetical protein APHAL10511_008676 [Amanita phalloides]|nr:hypothetical protein APHAL10511_008676 [Amanita phalloides]
MPVDRLSLEVYAYCPKKATPDVDSAGEQVDPVVLWSGGQNASDIYYPRTDDERRQFRLKTGKRIPPHHWDVYDHILSIPPGRVTTYKHVALAVGGSPRSVGNALRNNPFIPYVPCHRVIASDLTLGGYFGELGKKHKTGTRYHQKLGILAREGVEFTVRGKLARPAHVWFVR